MPDFLLYPAAYVLLAGLVAFVVIRRVNRKRTPAPVRQPIDFNDNFEVNRTRFINLLGRAEDLELAAMEQITRDTFVLTNGQLVDIVAYATGLGFEGRLGGARQIIQRLHQ